MSCSSRYPSPHSLTALSNGNAPEQIGLQMSDFKVGDKVILEDGSEGIITNLGKGEFSGRCTVTKSIQTNFNHIKKAEA